MRLKNGQHLWSSMVSTYWCSHQLNPRLQRQIAWTCLWKLLPWPRNASPTPNQNQTGTQKLPGSACSAVKRSAGFISKSFLMSCLASSDTCVVTYSAWVWLCLAARWGKNTWKKPETWNVWHHLTPPFHLLPARNSQSHRSRQNAPDASPLVERWNVPWHGTRDICGRTWGTAPLTPADHG